MRSAVSVPDTLNGRSMYAPRAVNERAFARQSIKVGKDVPTEHPRHSLVALHSCRSTSASGSAKGSGLNAIALTSVNTVTLAPMPSASESSATTVNNFDFERLRTANRMSLPIVFIVSSRLGRAAASPGLGVARCATPISQLNCRDGA